MRRLSIHGVVYKYKVDKTSVLIVNCLRQKSSMIPIDMLMHMTWLEISAKETNNTFHIRPCDVRDFIVERGL